MTGGFIEEFINWGLTTRDPPWQESTANGYRRELRRVEKMTGKPVEELTPDELRAFQADHASEPAASWNGRYFPLVGFFDYLEKRGFYQHLDTQGRHRVNPAKALTKRRLEPRAPRPKVDVLTAIADMPDGRPKTLALFLYHSGLKLSEATSIKEPPREESVHVRGHGAKREWVPIRRQALKLLAELGGRIPEKHRTIQRWFQKVGFKASDLTDAGRRDFHLGGASEDALEARSLLVGRPDLLDVARAYRDATEALEGPKPNPKTAITAAARALQEMLSALGAQGNSIGPLFDSLRSRGLFEGHDIRLADAVEKMVDWMSADRSERGDAHKDTDPAPEDAVMTLRIVAAIIVRLEALAPPS